MRTGGKLGVLAIAAAALICGCALADAGTQRGLAAFGATPVAISAPSVQVAQATTPAKPATPAPTATAPAAKPATTAPATAAPAAAAPASVASTLSPSDLQLVVTLLRNTLVALHQANLTGNYTVLRDLAAPSFHDNNTAAALADIFAPIRTRGIDLSTVVFLDPQLTLAKLNDAGMLDIAGSLGTLPVGVKFELLYQAVSNSWLLFGLSITADTPAQAALTPPAATAPAAAPTPAAKPATTVPLPATRP